MPFNRFFASRSVTLECGNPTGPVSECDHDEVVEGFATWRPKTSCGTKLVARHKGSRKKPASRRPVLVEGRRGMPGP